MPVDTSSHKAAAKAQTSWWQDVFAGGALGALLGLLMGLSTSPIVSIVITALVALLGALFGLTDKKLPMLSGASACRLGAFALTAFLVTPAAVWVRTHELLSPSVQEQIAVLKQMHVPEGREQYDMLRYIRFGIRPSAAGQEKQDGHAAPAPWTSSLYATHQTFCDQLVTLKVTSQPAQEYQMLFAGAGEEVRKIGEQIGKLPQAQQKAVFESAVIFLCMQ